MSIYSNNIIIPSLNPIRFSEPWVGNQELHYPTSLDYVQKVAPTDNLHLQLRSNYDEIFAKVISTCENIDMGDLGLPYKGITDNSTIQTCGDTSGDAEGSGGFWINDYITPNGAITNIKINCHTAGVMTIKKIHFNSDRTFDIISSFDLECVVGLNTFYPAFDYPTTYVDKNETIGVYVPSGTKIFYSGTVGFGYYTFIGEPIGTGLSFEGRTLNSHIGFSFDVEKQVIEDIDSVTESLYLTSAPNGWTNTGYYTFNGTKCTPNEASGNIPLVTDKCYGGDNRKIYWRFKWTNDSTELMFCTKPVRVGLVGSLIVATKTKLQIRGAYDGTYNNTIIKEEDLNAPLVIGRFYNVTIEKIGRIISATIIGETDTVDTNIYNIGYPQTYQSGAMVFNNIWQGSLQGYPCFAVHNGSIDMYAYNHTLLTSKKCEIAIFGDSITEGFTVTDSEKYSQLIRKSVDDRYCLMSGIGGDITDGVEKRFNGDFIGLYPKYVVLNIGSNTESSPLFEANIRWICTLIKLSGAIPAVCTIPVSLAETNIINGLGVDVIKIPIDVLLTISGAGSEVKGELYSGIALNGDPFNDNLHPNYLGHKAMYDQIMLSLRYTAPLQFAKTLFGDTYVFDLVIPAYAIGYGTFHIELSSSNTEWNLLADSWPFNVGDFDDTVLLTYFNETNDFETVFGTFSENTVFQFRVEGGIMPASTKDVSDISTFSDQFKQSALTYGMPSFTKTLRIGDNCGVPDWVFELLIAIGACDVLLVDNIQMIKASNWEAQETEKNTLIVSADMGYTTNRMTQTIDGYIQLTDSFGNPIANENSLILTL